MHFKKTCTISIISKILNFIPHIVGNLKGLKMFVSKRGWNTFPPLHLLMERYPFSEMWEKVTIGHQCPK
jgi:hypothetical protein